MVNMIFKRCGVEFAPILKSDLDYDHRAISRAVVIWDFVKILKSKLTLYIVHLYEI